MLDIHIKGIRYFIQTIFIDNLIVCFIWFSKTELYDI